MSKPAHNALSSLEASSGHIVGRRMQDLTFNLWLPVTIQSIQEAFPKGAWTTIASDRSSRTRESRTNHTAAVSALSVRRQMRKRQVASSYPTYIPPRPSRFTRARMTWLHTIWSGWKAIAASTGFEEHAKAGHLNFSTTTTLHTCSHLRSVLRYRNLIWRSCTSPGHENPVPRLLGGPCGLTIGSISRSRVARSVLMQSINDISAFVGQEALDKIPAGLGSQSTRS
jgi:hypothetical protein